MYNNILYPTDGSEGAKAALAHCRHLAEAHGATVHVLYVAENLAPHGLGGESDIGVGGHGGMVGDPKGGAGMVGTRKRREEFLADIEKYGHTLIEEVASHLGDADTQTVVRKGNPYEVILDYAKTQDVDLILMGTHGRSGLDRYLIGSVTEKVVRMSDVPVLTVRRNAAS